MSVLVGKPAPDFTVPAVLADGTIKDDFHFYDLLRGKYGLLFFYPLDFTFVCPTELIALDHRIEEFRSRGVEVVGVSIDSTYTHLAWRNTSVDDGGIGGVQYTLAADTLHGIAEAYDVVSDDGAAYRGAFIIDRDQIVRSQIVNDKPIGRDIDEILRIIDAVQFHEEHGEVCPAGWKRGDAGMAETATGVAAYLKSNAGSL